MDMTTTYMGLTLEHPVVPSASPLSKNLDGIRRLEDAGAPAVVMYSLFEEQIDAESHRLDHFLSYGEESFAEAISYFPDLGSYNVGPDAYLELIAAAKKSVSIPVIGSLNGVSRGGWTRYAKLIEDAGADALELNVYYIPTDPKLTAAEIERMYVEVLEDVKSGVKIPVAIKVGPFFSAFANTASALGEAGADGLVLFNRFYQPDFDLENLEVVPHLVLSDSDELRLPLRWTAILCGRIKPDIAITSGVHTGEDALKAMMAGAKIVQVASELLHNGLGRIQGIVGEMSTWMEEKEYESVAQMQGSMSQRNVAEPAAFERANYMKMLASWRPDPTGALI
ncbi:MAG: dihydroorotate dehydrogenase-like protein [Chthonomonadales bacterium]|nr:dihydroorotate dehydrogenase-like protein [Chthonomonadales bacterium]